MNLKNRSFRLFAVVSIISGLFVAPASANDISFDTSGIKVPAGISVVANGINYENGYSYMRITINSTIDTASKFLTFKDFSINGILVEGKPISAAIQYFDGDNLNQEFNLYMTQENITLQKLHLIISGNGTLESKSDLQYSKSYQPIIDSLSAMGLEVTEGYNIWNSNSEYGFYVMAKLKSGVAPFHLAVKSVSLNANEIPTVAMKNVERHVLMSSDPVEISLGTSKVDPRVNLTGVTLSAVFGVYTPSTVSYSATFPAGIEATAQQNIYYDQINNQSYINLLVKNTTKSSISVNVGGIVAVDSKSATQNSLAVVQKDYSLYTIAPTVSTNEEDLLHLTLVGSGDLSQDKTLSIIGNASLVTPSKIDLSKVKLPKGFSFLPIDLGNFSYDSKTKRTTLYVKIKNVKSDVNAPALSFASVKAPTAKMNAGRPYAGPWPNIDKKRDEYFYEIGSFAGDVRVGKKLSLNGAVITVARTKYKNTATIADNSAGIMMQTYPVTPEYWKYDSKTKTTKVFQYFYSTKENASAIIYTCNLQISLNGKSVKPLTTSYTYSPEKPNGDVAIAKLSGDLRVKGGSLVVTGNYTLEPCK